MNLISRREQRNLHAVRARKKRLRKKLLRELTSAIKESLFVSDPELMRISLSYGGFINGYQPLGPSLDPPNPPRGGSNVMRPEK